MACWAEQGCWSLGGGTKSSINIQVQTFIFQISLQAYSSLLFLDLSEFILIPVKEQNSHNAVIHACNCILSSVSYIWVWALQLLGIRCCRRKTIPSAASKMLQKQPAAIAGSCRWTTCRPSAKDKQLTYWPSLSDVGRTTYLQSQPHLMPGARQKRCNCQTCCSWEVW